MKKCLLFIFVFGITFSLYNVYTFASTYTATGYYAWWNGSEYVCRPVYMTNDTYWVNEYTLGGVVQNSADGRGETIDIAIVNCINNASSFDSTTQWDNTWNINVSGQVQINFPYNPYLDVNYETTEEYLESINPPEPEPTWWDNLTDWVGGFFDYVGDVAYDIWHELFPSEDILDWDSLDIVDPPSMTPLPTEIPYQTIINQTTGEIQYKYEISGTPIITSVPPPVSTYIITLPPDQGIAMPSGVVYPDDGLQDVIDAVDDNMDEYTGSIETIRDSFSTLPVKWFAFFGIPAAILIIAGVIKSLLG